MEDYVKTVDFYTKSLKIREELFEESHSDVADSLNNLGGLYVKLQNWPKAEEVYLKSLTIYLWQIYKNLKDVPKAEELYIKSLKN